MKKMYATLFCLTKLMSISAQYHQNDDSKMKLQVSHRKLPPSFQKPELMRQRLDRDLSAREQHKGMLKNVYVEKTPRYTQQLSSYWHSIINRYKCSTRRYELFRFPQMINKYFRGESAIKSLTGRFAPLLFCFTPLMSISWLYHNHSEDLRNLAAQDKKTYDTEIDFEQLKREAIARSKRKRREYKRRCLRSTLSDSRRGLPIFTRLVEVSLLNRCYGGDVSACKEYKKVFIDFYAEARKRKNKHDTLVKKIDECGKEMHKNNEGHLMEVRASFYVACMGKYGKELLDMKPFYSNYYVKSEGPYSTIRIENIHKELFDELCKDDWFYGDSEDYVKKEYRCYDCPCKSQEVHVYCRLKDLVEACLLGIRSEIYNDYSNKTYCEILIYDFNEEERIAVFENTFKEWIAFLEEEQEQEQGK